MTLAQKQNAVIISIAFSVALLVQFQLYALAAGVFTFFVIHLLKEIAVGVSRG